MATRSDLPWDVFGHEPSVQQVWSLVRRALLGGHSAHITRVHTAVFIGPFGEAELNLQSCPGKRRAHRPTALVPSTACCS